MKMELLDNGCLKILLSDEEVAAIGLDFSSAKHMESHTQTAIRKLVRMARQELGFPQSGNMTVEAIPLDCGCLLLLSPVQVPANRPPARIGQPIIYRCEDFGAIQTLAEILPHDLYTSLYSQNGWFYLCRYPCRESPRIDAVIREFMTPVVSGYAAEAALAEHGRCLALGDALSQVGLTAPEYHTPKPPHPPH